MDFNFGKHENIGLRFSSSNTRLDYFVNVFNL